jgi:1-acyl-sn-glycerol-3-phosphate acyltransferase
MTPDAMIVWLGVAILLVMIAYLFHWLFRKADAANVADWGSKWKNRLDGLNRLFLQNYHKCHIEPVPLPAEGPALVVANHISGLDPMMLLAACQRPVHFIIASEQYYRFGLTWLFRLGGCIPVDRASRSDSAFRAALQALREGKVVGLFPEGGIHLPGKGPKRLKRGVARLAKLSSCPVYPTQVSGVRLPGHVLPAVLWPNAAVLRSFSPVACEILEEQDCLKQLLYILTQTAD